jgi:hypothetical protein
MFFTAAWITGATYWLGLAVTAAGFTYYNIPLLETGRPTIGANQYAHQSRRNGGNVRKAPRMIRSRTWSN